VQDKPCLGEGLVIVRVIIYCNSYNVRGFFFNAISSCLNCLLFLLLFFRSSDGARDGELVPSRSIAQPPPLPSFLPSLAPSPVKFRFSPPFVSSIHSHYPRSRSQKDWAMRRNDWLKNPETANPAIVTPLGTSISWHVNKGSHGDLSFG